MVASSCPRASWPVLLLLVHMTESFQNIAGFTRKTSLGAHMFDPFQGASRYVVPNPSDSDGSSDESKGVAAAVGIGAPSSSATQQSTVNADPSLSTSIYTIYNGSPAMHGAASSRNGSVYIGGANETVASSHGLERNSLLKNEGLSDLGSTMIENTTGGSSVVKEAPAYKAVWTSNGAATTNRKQILATAPSMSDLVNRLSSLQREIKERNALVQGTVSKLSNATGKVASRLQTSSDNVHQIVSELKLKAEAAQKDATLKEETIERVQQEFKRLEESTSQKLSLLADQLQESKTTSHETQIALQQKADEEQSKLRDRIQSIEEELKKQINLTAKEAQRADESLHTRLALEKELQSTKSALEASIRELERTLGNVKAEHAEERKRFDELHRQELKQLRDNLETVVREAKESKDSLQANLRTKEAEYKKSIQDLRAQNDSKEKTLNEKVQHFTNELQRVMLESQQRLAAEQDKAKGEREKLLLQIQSKEEELRQETLKASALDVKVKDYNAKRIELERELDSLKKEHERSIASWQKRLDELEDTRLSERTELESKLAWAEVEAKNMTKKEAEHIETIQQLRNDMEKHKERTQARLEEARYSTAQLQDELKFQIKLKENELEEQTKLNENMMEREQKHFARIADLGGELSALKNKYARELALWESRVKTLQEEQVSERKTSNATISKLTRDAAMKLENVVLEAKLTQATLQHQVASKESAIRDLTVQQNRTVDEMKSEIQRIRNELNRTKADAESTLAQEKSSADRSMHALRLEIEKKQATLEQEIKLKEEYETQSKKQMDLRTQVEGELSALKNKYAREIALSEERLEALRKEMSKQQNDARENLAVKEAEIQSVIEKHAQEVEKLKALHAEGLLAKDSEHRRYFQQLEDSSSRKERDLSEQIKSLNNSLAQLKAENEGKLRLEREDSLARQHDLRSQIAQKEDELRTQLRAIQQANVATEQARARQQSTQDEFLALKSKYKSSMSEWESKVKDMEDLRRKEQDEAQAASARTEREAKEKIDSIQEQLRAKEKEFSRCMQTMDHDYRQKIGDLHQQYQNREKDLTIRIESEKSKLEESREQAEAALLSEQRSLKVKQDELDKVVRERDEIIQLKSQTIDELQRAESKQKEVVQRLEKDLADIKGEHATAIKQWTERCSSLQTEMKALQSAHEEERLKNERETTLQIEEAKAKVEKIRSNMELAAKARDALFQQKIDSLQASLAAAESEVDTQIQQLHKSGDEAKAQHAALLKRFHEKEKELHDQLAKTSEKMTESERLRMAQSDLERQLDSIKKEQETIMSDWIAKHNTLEESIVEIQKASADDLLRKEVEWKERMDTALRALSDEKHALETSLAHKERLLSEKIKDLKESSSQKELELTKKLQVVMDEYQQYKFSAHQALMEAQHQAQALAAEVAELPHKNLPPGSLERIRFDLSKLLLKKEVEFLRKTNGAETDPFPQASLRPTKRFDHREESKPPKKSKRASIRERLAGIFFRSPDADSAMSRQMETEKELVYRQR